MAEVGSFTSRAHADMAAGMLDAHGVSSDVRGDDAGGALPHVAVGSHGYRLHVADGDVEEAQALLAGLLDDTGASGKRAGDAAGDATLVGPMNRVGVFRAVAGVLLAVLAVGVLISMLT